MLRLPSNPLWLALAPRQVALVRRRRGRAEVLGCTEVNGTGHAMIAEMLEAAAALLDRQRIAGSRVHTVLSDRLVRYALLPFSPAHLDAHEERALCQARFAELYGPMEDWQLGADRARYGQARLCCALTPALAGGLAALLASRKLSAGAIVPHFVCSWNARRAALAGQAGLLAVLEPDSVVIGRYAAGTCIAVRAHYADSSTLALGELLMRERLHLQCAADTPAWACGSVALAADPGVRIDAPRNAAPAIAMALAGAYA